MIRSRERPRIEKLKPFQKKSSLKKLWFGLHWLSHLLLSKSMIFWQQISNSRTNHYNKEPKIDKNVVLYVFKFLFLRSCLWLHSCPMKTSLNMRTKISRRGFFDCFHLHNFFYANSLEARGGNRTLIRKKAEII